MARNLPFRVIGQCIDCSGKTRRWDIWRCETCESRVNSVRRGIIAAVQKAIRIGQLPRADSLNCADCGDIAEQYDHRDYTKPLDVVPVCRACNFRRGPAAPLVEAQPAQTLESR